MNPNLVKSIIYPSLRFIKRDDVFQKLEELEKNQWVSRQELEKLQWEKLEKLIKYVYDKVPYYTSIFKEMGLKPKDIQAPSDFLKIPILTKKLIGNNANRIITIDPSVKGRSANTGGSTGETLYFYKGLSSYGVANLIRLNRWCGKDIGDREAVFWGTPFDEGKVKRATNRLKEFMQNIMFFSTFNMSEESMIKYSRTLSKFQPHLIRGYPSALYIFADFLKKKGIGDIKPRAVISTGEKSYPFQKELLEEVFGCKVYERYGSNEFGNIAHECNEHHGLHILNDMCYVEFLKDNKPVEKGESGEIVVTSFHNLYMPFVRYKIGDMGVYTDAQCSCGRGFPMIEEVVGRSFDMIITPSGRALGGFFWTFISRAVPGIKQFQVCQKDINTINFKIVPDKAFQKGSEKQLGRIIKERAGTELTVNFKIVDEIPLTPSGKFRFIVSELSTERLVMKSKIHKAVVTGSDLKYNDSVTVDEDLMKMVNLKEYEKVLVVNNTNGARVETFIVKGKKGSGIVSINGAAAHHIRKGDEIILMSFTWTNKGIKPQVILVDENNKFIEFLAGGEF